MGTDRYAYASRLRRKDPLAKLIVSAVPAAFCIAAGNGAVCLVTLAAMLVLCIAMGGVRVRVVLHMLRIPCGFLILAVLTIIVRRVDSAALIAIAIGAGHYGVTTQSLREGAEIFTRAIAVVSCMYFFTLTTPMTDFTRTMEKLRVPRLFVELTEMIYRFIFVLTDTAERIKTAQAARLGYRDAKTWLRSTGTLASMVFLRAYRKSDKVFTALEARGYDGALVTAAAEYESGIVILLLGAAVVCAQVTVLLLGRFVNG